MSFWGGFVEGFATEVGKAIDKDVERTNQLVDDTVKIGLNKYLENEEEIKKEKKTIRDELDMLKALKFSLPKAASIVRAGQTANVIKLTNKYSGADPNDLWDGTTKFAEEKGLTVNDILDKLVKTPKFDAGNLKVEQPQGSLLSALGLGTDVSSRIQKGITTRVGGTEDTTTARDDVSIMPGGLTKAGKSLVSTSSDTIDKRVLAAIDRLDIPQIEKDKIIINIKAGGKFENILGFGFPSGDAKSGGASLPQNMQELKNLYKKAEVDGDQDAKEELKKKLNSMRSIMGNNYTDAIIDILDD
tara:strand:- start:1133 stop:2035 length:903 start_codon:yes stop_codon:yes gene_type:complete